MRAIYMGKNKPVVVEGLKVLLDKGIEVAAVVASQGEPPNPKGLTETAARHGIPVTTAEELEGAIEGEVQDRYGLGAVDLVLSFVYWKRIRKTLIQLPKIGCVNFHAAPLPEYRGWGVYNFGVYENAPTWGVTAHFVDESFDTGDIIKVRRFDTCPGSETAFSLARKCEPHLLELLKEVVTMALDTGSLPRTPQDEGRYFSREMTEELRKIRPTDTREEIERKIRAFWYPPHPGATIELQGKTYTVIDDALLNDIAETSD